MARRPRIDLAGWHHVINRGVDRGTVYHSDEDKEKFLAILCKACNDYRVNVHDYCLMDNHYHLLVETSSENLSLFMRQINSNYAIYFNKRYHRTGHLWQGRYQSWYVVNQAYLYSLFRYIEHNPIEAGIIAEAGQYPYTLLGALLHRNQQIIPCAKHSRLLAEYEYEGIQELLSRTLSPDEMAALHQEQRRKVIVEEHAFRQEKSQSLHAHFAKSKTLEQRNHAVMEALSDGYKQAQIARYLGLSPTAIAKIKVKMGEG
jgi:REP element-mobilizing transposase RayT